MAALPTSHRLVLPDGTRLVGVHAAPHSDDDTGITPDLADRDLGRLLAASDADVVCGGHTHQQPIGGRVARTPSTSEV
jgi:predicted phosphodiesterase